MPKINIRINGNNTLKIILVKLSKYIKILIDNSSGVVIKSGILGSLIISSDIIQLLTLNIHNILSNNIALIGGLVSGLLIVILKDIIYNNIVLVKFDSGIIISMYFFI